ncbi:glomulin, FKBP associated protein b [Chanos chanos]|uniref:Glomulin, FKBP associated protein b n=1 Tax=Chanos chanos TaxID=29144 RepID=A0A6J2WR11_CHACN|nr:glomulin-like [Chanos chanos]
MAVNQLNDIIQRWRVTPEKDLRQEDYELFLNAGSTCIAQGDSAQLLDFIKEEKNETIVRSMGSGLLAPLVTELLKKEKNPVHCHSIVEHLVQTCDAKEVLEILLEKVDDAHPDLIADTITLLVKPLQTVLLRMGDTKAPSVGLALNALQKQVSKLPVPCSRKQEQEDKYGLCRCCTALVNFVQPFVQEMKTQDSQAAQDARLRTELLKFCMESLREPLLHAQLDREVDTPRNSPLWNFATEILAILPAIQEPLPKLLFYHPLRGREDTISAEGDTGHPNESRACLAYLVFVQLIAMEIFPAVFSPLFVLQCNMEYVNLLLSRKDESWILKGLDLYVKSLERVMDNSLPVELLDLKSFYSVPQNLIELMTECPIQHLRIKGLVVFQLFVEKLEEEAKHKFFRCIFKTSNHAGVQSIILKNIKNQVEFSTKSGKEDDWFVGTRLISLLRETVCIPDGADTDLLHCMDRVMESLNLLRYLLIREKKKPNGVWPELCSITESYIKMLRVCLSMSKSYYAAELKALREGEKVKAKELKQAKSNKSFRNIKVKNEKLSSMSPEVQHQVLQCALVTFDLMESLVVRIEEITEKEVKHEQ